MPSERVSYIPSLIDITHGPDPLIFRPSPTRSIWNTIKHGVYHLWTLPLIVVPFWTATQTEYSELAINRDNMISLFSQIGLFALSVLGYGGVVYACFWAPAIFTLLGLGAVTVGVRWISRPLNAGTTDGLLESNVKLDGPSSAPGEKWFFINGVTVGTHWLHHNLNLLSTIFHRPITGLQNPTKGLFLDLLECVLSRTFLYSTSDTRAIHHALKRALLDPATSRIIIIAHSQGGIITSAVLEALFAELDEDTLAKIEVYTFGCAAVRFLNPIRIDENGQRRRTIEHIEHYANELDFVSRVGVLRFAVSPRMLMRRQREDDEEIESLFVGKVFVRLGVMGHMLGQHYLEPMFLGEKVGGFLEARVRVEENVVETAEEVAGREGTEEKGRVRGRAEVVKGHQVRELSRLHLYRGGKRPEDFE